MVTVTLFLLFRRHGFRLFDKHIIPDHAANGCFINEYENNLGAGDIV